MLKNLTTSVIVLALSSSPVLAKEKLSLKSSAEKASYGIGINIGHSLKAQNIPDLNVDNMFTGIKDALEDREMRVSKEELIAAFTEIQKKEAEEKSKLAEDNLKKGESFLAENKKQQGVKVTESGLQYKIIQEGTGSKPKADDVIVANYRGSLIDGTEFDSSYKRNEPVEFPVNRVIPGWTEALQMMPEGSKWQLFIPAKLAYGEFSPTPAIPPNSTLVFEVELLKVKPAETEEVTKEEAVTE